MMTYETMAGVSEEKGTHQPLATGRDAFSKIP
jgi:hypothetical protein